MYVYYYLIVVTQPTNKIFSLTNKKRRHVLLNEYNGCRQGGSNIGKKVYFSRIYCVCIIVAIVCLFRLKVIYSFFFALLYLFITLCLLCLSVSGK